MVDDADIEKWKARAGQRIRTATQKAGAKGSSASAKVKGGISGSIPKRLKNPSGTQVRLRTGVVYVGLTSLCVLAGTLPTLIMLMVVAGICAGEFFYMLAADAKLPNTVLGVLAAVAYPASLYFAGLAGTFLVTVLLLLALIIWYVFWIRTRLRDVSLSFFGAAYAGLLLCGIMAVRMALPGIWGGCLTLGIFMSVWLNDAAAYLVGSKLGRHKMAPRISPKKSWEGFIAGIITSMLLWCPLTLIPGVAMSIPQALLFGFLCGLAGVLGDLAESRIKRNSGVKDSGTIMPGHGGLLDRCDSLFIVSMAAAILLDIGGCIPFTL